MTEAEWLACQEVGRMLSFVDRHYEARGRILRRRG
jgi:hypothetical protein